MPKRPSPFEGEGQEGEVRHPQPVMLSVAKHPHWIPHCVRNDIVCHAERKRKRSEASILDSSLRSE
jgi:hypothetical protein